MSGVRRRIAERLAAVGAALAVLATGVGVVALTEGSSEAAPSLAVLNGFDPGDIISDAVMYRSTTMTSATIQSFLNAQQPVCASGATCLKTQRIDVPSLSANLMCKAVTGVKDASVATVIAKVAAACSVNPQVILVMLQKEQTLITGRRPYKGETVDLIYRKATGLGCPDTAACDPAKYGLFNQLYGVAYWLIRYTSPPGTTGAGWTQFNWFPIGTPIGVLYNPSAACGAGPVTIRNKATASLYYYTPYQPNAAALAAGWGSGNSCSAYGNRNFYLYFTTWFGSTHSAPAAAQIVVNGAIGALWKKLGGAKGSLGAAKANAVHTTVKGGGYSQVFAGGTIYSSATKGVGAWAVTGAALTEYKKVGGPASALGWPRSSVAKRTANGGGTVQTFQVGGIWTSKAGTFSVGGNLAKRYAKTKNEAGPLSWPTADAVVSTVHGGGTAQAFAKGRIATAKGQPYRVVTGAIWSRWHDRGFESGTMGWPTSELTTLKAHGATGTVQTFQGANAYIRGGTLITVNSPILADYAYHGAAAGALGWPVHAVESSTTKGGGQRQRFQYGDVYWSAVSGAHPLTGAQKALYDRRGGLGGTLGWPGATVKDAHGIGGRVTAFTNGRIYVSSAGAAAVLGDFLDRYLAKKGTGGTYGWPVADAKRSGTKRVQTFEHGTITVSD